MRHNGVDMLAKWLDPHYVKVKVTSIEALPEMIYGFAQRYASTSLAMPHGHIQGRDVSIDACKFTIKQVNCCWGAYDVRVQIDGYHNSQAVTIDPIILGVLIRPELRDLDILEMDKEADINMVIIGKNLTGGAKDHVTKILNHEGWEVRYE